MKSHAAIFSLPTGKPRENILDFKLNKSILTRCLPSHSREASFPAAGLGRELAANSEVGATSPTTMFLIRSYVGAEPVDATSKLPSRRSLTLKRMPRVGLTTAIDPRAEGASVRRCRNLCARGALRTGTAHQRITRQPCLLKVADVTSSPDEPQDALAGSRAARRQTFTVEAR